MLCPITQHTRSWMRSSIPPVLESTEQMALRPSCADVSGVNSIAQSATKLTAGTDTLTEILVAISLSCAAPSLGDDSMQ